MATTKTAVPSGMVTGRLILRANQFRMIFAGCNVSAVCASVCIDNVRYGDRPPAPARESIELFNSSEKRCITLYLSEPYTLSYIACIHASASLDLTPKYGIGYALLFLRMLCAIFMLKKMSTFSGA